MSILEMLGIGDVATNAFTALTNFGLQKSQQNWEKNAQQITWNREDNAIQRRVADLRAAGLSPTLAAGSAASTSAPIRLTTPQVDYKSDMLGKALEVQMVQKAQAEIGRTNAEISLMDKQKEQMDLKNDLLRQDMSFRSQYDPLRIKQAEVSLDYEIRTNPDKIKILAEDLKQEIGRTKGIDLENKLRELNLELKELDIPYTQLRNLRQEIQRDIDIKELEKIELDIITKEVALKLLKKQDIQYARDMNLWRLGKIPSNMNWPDVLKFGSYASGTIGDILKPKSAQPLIEE